MASLRLAFDLSGLTLLSAVVVCGPLLTALVPLSEASWELWLSVRVAVQAGCGLWGGVGVAGLAHLGGAGRLRWGAAGALLGTLLAVNPVLDLLRGPLVIDNAQILASGTQTRTTWGARPGGVTPRGDGIFGVLEVQDADGRAHCFTPYGLHATRLRDMLESCGGATTARVVGLRHVDLVLGLDCTR